MAGSERATEFANYLSLAIQKLACSLEPRGTSSTFDTEKYGDSKIIKPIIQVRELMVIILMAILMETIIIIIITILFFVFKISLAS